MNTVVDRYCPGCRHAAHAGRCFVVAVAGNLQVQCPCKERAT